MAMKGFRRKYSENGPDGYYERCTCYINPHAIKFTSIIKKLLQWLPCDLIISSELPVLDLACGSGQITSIFLQANIPYIVGLDPYLHQQYVERTKQFVYPNSFEDIIEKKVILPKFSLIICSYGLHLCQQLRELLDILKESTSYLCVISPHGLPVIPVDTGWNNLFTFKYSNIKTSLYTTLPSVSSICVDKEETTNESLDSIPLNLFHQQEDY